MSRDISQGASASTSATVRRIVARVLADAGDGDPFADDESLVVSGRLSSLDVVAIVEALEHELGLVVDADSFDPLRFDTVSSIAGFVGSSAS